MAATNGETVIARDELDEDGPFLAAAKSGDTNVAIKLLGAIPDPWNVRSPHGETALHWAATNDDVALIEALLRKGCPPNASNYMGTTPLYYAASKNAASSCFALMIGGADPRDKSGYSGKYPEQVAEVPRLKERLMAARVRLERAIADVPALQVCYRIRRWGIDTLDSRLLKVADASGHTVAIQPDKEWIPRSDAALHGPVPQAAKYLLDEWQRFQVRLGEWEQDTQANRGHASDRMCAYCASGTGKKRRCGRCKAMWYCDGECQAAAWPVHRILGCVAAE